MTFDVDIRDSDSPIVKTIWRSYSTSGGSFISTAVSDWEMVITRQQNSLTLSVRGPETQAKRAPVPENAEFMGITFQPGVFMPQMPAERLVDHEIHLTVDSRNTFKFLGTTWQLPTFENADIFVSRLLRENILSFDPVVHDVLRGLKIDLSLRSIQRRFLHVTGLSYKTIQQIERARKAALLLKEGLPIPEVAYETGFFDQAHLTNSLKRFYGQTPAQMFSSDENSNVAFFQYNDSMKRYD